MSCSCRRCGRAAPTTSSSPRSRRIFARNGVRRQFPDHRLGRRRGAGHDAAAPSARIAAGDMVTTELTPCVDGYYAQICRTLVVGEATDAQRRAFARLSRGDGGRHRRGAPGVTAADVAHAENDVFRKHGLGEYTTSEYTRVRGHGMGLFADSQAAHPGGRDHRARAGHGADRASQHLPSRGRLHRAGRRRRGDQGRLRGADPDAARIVRVPRERKKQYRCAAD